jgi:hypothetical protein
MVYKKYIKKDGKLYGPYIYQSKRVDGKVISEYCGPGKKDNKTLIFSLIGLFIFVGLILLFLIFKGNFTGNVVLNSPNLEGVSENSLQEMSITLKQGEFVPSSANIVFETSNGNYEYPLKDLIQESPSIGEYFVEGETVSGEGEGYGLAGKITSYPEVEFTLISRTISQTQEESVDNSETLEGEQNQEIINEEPAPLESQSNSEEGIVSEILEGVSNFFLGLSLTGNVISEDSEIKEIQATASQEHAFVYDLNAGETLELSSGSVKIGDQKLEDNIIKTSSQDGKFIVEVTYSRIEEGYGESFLGNEEKNFQFEIPNEVIISGDYNVKIIYNSDNTPSEELNIETSDEVLEQIVIEETTPIPTVNVSETVISELTLEEKELLMSEFGNFSVETVKSELFNGRYIIGYSLGDYEIEYSYDSSLNQDLLNSQIEMDRIKWLKDISANLADQQNIPQQVSEFDSTFSIF